MEYSRISPARPRRREPASCGPLHQAGGRYRDTAASSSWPCPCRLSHCVLATLVFLLTLSSLSLASPLPPVRAMEVAPGHRTNDDVRPTSLFAYDVIRPSVTENSGLSASNSARPLASDFMLPSASDDVWPSVNDVTRPSVSDVSRLTADSYQRVDNGHHMWNVGRTRRSARHWDVGLSVLAEQKTDDQRVSERLLVDSSDEGQWDPAYEFSTGSDTHSASARGDPWLDTDGLLAGDDDGDNDNSFADLMLADAPASGNKQPRHAPEPSYFLLTLDNYMLALWPNGTVGRVRPSAQHHDLSLVKIPVLSHKQLNLQRLADKPVGYVGIQNVKTGQYLCVNSRGRFYSQAFTGGPSADCRFYEEQNEQYTLYYSATHGNNVTSELCVSSRHNSTANTTTTTASNSKQGKPKQRDGLPGICRKWYLAFNKEGKVMKGPRTQPTSHALFFSKPESEDFHFRGTKASGMKTVHSPFRVGGDSGGASHHSRIAHRQQQQQEEAERSAVNSRATDGTDGPFSGSQGGGRHKPGHQGHGQRDHDAPFRGSDATQSSSEVQYAPKPGKKSQRGNDGNGGLGGQASGEPVESMFSAHHDGSDVRGSKKKKNKNKHKKKKNGGRRYDLPILV